MALLEVEGLTTSYASAHGTVRAVDNVSLQLAQGEVLGLVGESGSGKTTLAMSLLRLIKAPGVIERGQVCLAGHDVLKMTDAEVRSIRGGQIALIPQNSMNALNPVFRVADQVAEALLVHNDLTRSAARTQALHFLELVGIGAERAMAHPYEFSGGMRQRAVIAMALVTEPMLVIADEPVTGLDVIVQAQVLSLLRNLQRSLRLSMLFVSHDLPVVAHISDRIAVMYGGRIVEEGPTQQVTRQPRHAYTRALLSAFPRLRDESPRAAPQSNDV